MRGHFCDPCIALCPRSADVGACFRVCECSMCVPVGFHVCTHVHLCPTSMCTHVLSGLRNIYVQLKNRLPSAVCTPKRAHKTHKTHWWVSCRKNVTSPTICASTTSNKKLLLAPGSRLSFTLALSKLSPTASLWWGLRCMGWCLRCYARRHQRRRRTGRCRH